MLEVNKDAKIQIFRWQEKQPELHFQLENNERRPRQKTHNSDRIVGPLKGKKN